ncbi:MBL fold metallo-hydrolase [Kroppenstedtia eburnea]|uniref:Hydroxyacylglutathione hydrolase n=1 Tax=Kroppenstedtia eburnea TaxID=714067 RepID=A0A1N7MHA8_9BACL|nr:MBL fold metallo-hydrolase [Kroppenstedtia eburnea]QKI81570.1 MBL fold metallo-hydrolase [Kroppenstedtia eburnea]SIS85437.1 hydroxyacylglutathione hydrolase [Kroppenstedtia eburnea]
MYLRYFYNDKLAHASYLAGCPVTGEALVIDPDRDVEPYLQTARKEGMNIVAAAETHIHADYVSGARELAEQAGAKLYLSGETQGGTGYPYTRNLDHQLLKDGDSFQIGNLRLDVLHTPGHTPEHLSYLLTDGGVDEPMGIFTGDFVFVGDVGRPDLLEKAVGVSGSAAIGADQLFHSLKRFKELPDFLQVWPAHGAGSACGKALGAVPSSTVGYEKRHNWALKQDDPQRFKQELLQGQPEPPTYFAVMKQVNHDGPELIAHIAAPEKQESSPEVVAEVLKQGATVIDSRPAVQFASGHLPGTLNIPYGKSFTNWAGWLVDYERPLYLIADSDQVEKIRKDLLSIGIDTMRGFFSPDLFRNTKPGELERYENASPAEAVDKVNSGEWDVVDVRMKSEWDQGHIPGARHIMLGHLNRRAQEVPRDKPVLIHCKSGGRSAIACSLLQAQGRKNVINLKGGFDAWKKQGFSGE